MSTEDSCSHSQQTLVREPPLIDGATGAVIEDGPHRIKSTTQGFGPTVQLLEVAPFRLAPWLTPELCEQEIEMQGTKIS